MKAEITAYCSDPGPVLKTARGWENVESAKKTHGHGRVTDPGSTGPGYQRSFNMRLIVDAPDHAAVLSIAKRLDSMPGVRGSTITTL